MKTVFFDVDTQIDFVFPAGALYVPGAEDILPAIAKLNQFAASHGIIVISTMDAHSENDPEFRTWKPHCVVGTVGQEKPQQTLLQSRSVIPSEKGQYELPAVQQILLEKQVLDCFANPNLPALLEQLNADRYVVYGVVTEVCVKFAAFGLLKTGKPVSIITDAVRGLNTDEAAAIVAQFTSEGGQMTTVGELTAG
jgi:nicotinamidase/pyrazinamidase